MLKVTAILTFALACAGTDSGAPFEADAGAELGQTAQALVRPSYYGNTGNPKCDTAAASGNCYVPATRTRRLKFHASTCSSWWQARMVAAEAVYMPTVQDAGWTYLQGGSSGIAINVRCSTTNKCPTAACAIPAVYTCASGVCKVSQTDIYVDVNEIESPSYSDWNWALLTEVQRRRIAENTWVHEVGHAFGLGHEAYGIGTDPDVNWSSPTVPNNAMDTSSFYRVNYWQHLDHAHIINDLEDYQP